MCVEKAVTRTRRTEYKNSGSFLLEEHNRNRILYYESTSYRDTVQTHKYSIMKVIVIGIQYKLINTLL